MKPSANTDKSSGRFMTSVLRWIDSEADIDFITPTDRKKVDWLRIVPLLFLHLMCLGVFWSAGPGQLSVWRSCFTWSVCLPSQAFITAIFRIKPSKPIDSGSLYSERWVMPRFKGDRSRCQVVIGVLMIIMWQRERTVQ